MKRLTAILASSFIILSLALTACGDGTGSKGNTQADSTKTPSSDTLSDGSSLSKIKLPEGFKLSIYARVPNARSMCWGEKGTLFVGNRDSSSVYAVVDSNKDGKADSVYVVASGLHMPNGVAFKNGSLYVAEVSRITRYDDIENKLASPPKPAIVYDKYPDKDHHGWKYIAFGPDGKLYVPVGAPCNVCDEKDPVFASITRINPDGTGFEIYAKGVRNSVGFAWHPDTKELWFTDNGRDMLGDEIPNCELNYAPKQGMHFGFPYCHQGNLLDSLFGKGKKCESYTAPAQLMGPHVAPLGMRFYTGSMFPAEYQKKIFVALHGSWNRSKKNGYKVMMATLDGNKVVKYEPFAEGWLDNENVAGRPNDVEVAPDGALLISDDKSGVIYRVRYERVKGEL